MPGNVSYNIFNYSSNWRPESTILINSSGQETIQDIPVTDAERGDQLYGMSLSKIQASSDDGNPLPQFVLDIIEYLTKNAKFADGIFRKNGLTI